MRPLLVLVAPYPLKNGVNYGNHITLEGKARNLDMRQSALLESAYFAVKPPEREVRVKSVTPSSSSTLATSSLTSLLPVACHVDTIAKALRRLPWEDETEDIEHHVLSAMQHLAETKYLVSMALADLLSAISRCLPKLVVRFIDTLLESVHRGLGTLSPRTTEDDWLYAPDR